MQHDQTSASQDVPVLMVQVPAMVRRPDDQIINVWGAALNYVLWSDISISAFCADKNSPGDG